MKKTLALILTAMMILAIGTCALAATTITVEEAKQIALDKAGLTADRVTFTKAHEDRDDGRPEWEVAFFADGMEYEFDIDAATGAITDFDTETHTRDFAAQNLTEEEAKQIALAKVGLKAEDVRFKKVKLDNDDGRLEWEVEFLYGGLEYEFDIDAATAAIVGMDIDDPD